MKKQSTPNPISATRRNEEQTKRRAEEKQRTTHAEEDSYPPPEKELYSQNRWRGTAGIDKDVRLDTLPKKGSAKK